MNPVQAILVPRDQIEESLRMPPNPGKNLVEPFRTFAKTSNLPFQILEDVGVARMGNPSEVHTKEADLWIGLEGEAYFVCGGELEGLYFKKRPDGSDNTDEPKGKSNKGGQELIVRPGDYLWIPASVPHTHWAEQTRLMIIKIPQAAK